MNPSIALALILDLYAQLQVANQEIASLREQLAGTGPEDSPNEPQRT